MLKHLAFVVLIGVFVHVGACEEVESAPPPPPSGSGTPTAGTTTVGANGGVVEVGGVRLVVPPGALPADVAISIEAVPESGPDTHEALSPVYRFSPDGLRFAVEATIDVPYTGDGD